MIYRPSVSLSPFYVHIIFPFSLFPSAFFGGPEPNSIFLTVFKGAIVHSTVWKIVDTLATPNIVSILTNVKFAIGAAVSSLSMPIALDPHARICIAVSISYDSVTFFDIIDPLANVILNTPPLVLTQAVLPALIPLTVVIFAIAVTILALAVFHVVEVASLVHFLAIG